MKPWELFEWLHDIDYRENATSFNWAVKVRDDERKIYVAVKYSTSTLDWIVNFLFFFIPQIRNWYVYFTCLGWQSAFNSCKRLVMNEVLWQMNRHPDYKVVCCGHSYGGASSVLTGIEIFFATAEKPDLVTFGAPKPLFLLITKLFARLFFGKVEQYAHRADIVTYMPPLPGYWNLRVIRVGKFSFKALFDGDTHQRYGDKSLYEGVET